MRRYLRGWQARRPAGVVSRDYLTGSSDPRVGVHRRAFFGAGVGTGRWGPAGRSEIGARAAWAPRQAWLLGRWYAGVGRAAVAGVAEEQLVELAPRIGVPPEVQRARLAALARKHAIAPQEALALGLVRDGMTERWAEYVFECEHGWNAAASAPGAGRHQATLGDKVATARILNTAGIACVASLVIAPLSGGDRVESLVDAWLATWPKVHGKRRAGSRGEGAFELWRRESVVPLHLREHQGRTPVVDPLQWLRRNLSGHEYLIQPRLTSHPMFEGVADPTDVVTIRAVTRDLGAGPHLFCAWLEVPLPITGEQQYYVLLRLSAAGEVIGPVLREWLLADPAEDAPESADARPADPVAAALAGLTVPGYSQLLADSLAAHRQFAGLFAAAWDVAITPDGNLFLEGNSGFGVDTPQRLAGGLLADLPPRHDH